MKLIEWRCRLRRPSFGLSDEYTKNLYEEFFILKFHGGWSFTEAYNLPIGLREWFVKRLVKHFEDEKEEYDSAMRKSRSR